MNEAAKNEKYIIWLLLDKQAHVVEAGLHKPNAHLYARQVVGFLGTDRNIHEVFYLVSGCLALWSIDWMIG